MREKLAELGSFGVYWVLLGFWPVSLLVVPLARPTASAILLPSCPYSIPQTDGPADSSSRA